MRDATEWWRIESLMLKSFTGQMLSEVEMAFLQEAHRDDPGEYAMRHERVKSAEIARRRQW